MALSTAQVGGDLARGRYGQAGAHRTHYLTLLRMLRNVALHVLGTCGHWAQIERSREFVELASSFSSREAGVGRGQ